MIENLLNGYFKQSLTKTTITISLILAIAFNLLLACVVVIIRDPDIAWWILLATFIFSVLALSITYLIINNHRPKNAGKQNVYELLLLLGVNMLIKSLTKK